MKNIVFIAPPAAGKGTQSLLLQEKYHLAHISTGDLLRKASQEESERGYFIKEALQKGQLVSDEITLELLTERLKEKDCDSAVHHLSKVNGNLHVFSANFTYAF